MYPTCKIYMCEFPSVSYMNLLHEQVPAHMLGECYACMGHEKEFQIIFCM